MLCNVCKQDHAEPLQKWCDRSELEIENNYLKAENFRLRENLQFTLHAAEYLYKPDKPLQKGLDPTFYFTLSYEGDLELIEKTRKARVALNG